MASDGEVVDNLQIWVPQDSFTERHNIVAFLEGLSGLQIVDVKTRQGESTLYCSDIQSNVAYEVITDNTVGTKEEELRFQGSPVTSCMQGDGLEITGERRIRDEARARALHLGLGRTCLWIAGGANDRETFRMAFEDLQKVFAMLRQPAHEFNALNKINQKEGLLYLFSRAARRYKTISKEDAKQLTDKLASSFVDGESWRQRSGGHFERAIGFTQAMPRHIKRADTGRSVKRPVPNRLIVREEGPPRVRKTPAEKFIGSLDEPRRRGAYQVKLDRVHERAQQGIFTVLPEKESFDTKKLILEGVTAYFEEHSDGAIDMCAQIAHFLAPHRKIDLTKILTAASLVVAKVNAEGGASSRLEMPGMQIEGLPVAFRGLRTVARSKRYGRREDANTKKLGDIVEAYINATFLEEN